LEEGENGESCLYWAVKFPWPMANRDYVYRRCIKTNQEEGTIALVFKGMSLRKVGDFIPDDEAI